jgi:hypothetical protein
MLLLYITDLLSAADCVTAFLQISLAQSSLSLLFWYCSVALVHCDHCLSVQA